MEIRKIGVLGLGTMGAGIATICAQSGHDVVALEVNDEFIKKGIGNVERFLKIAIRRKEITQDDFEPSLGRIKCTTNIDDLHDRQLVIEAVIENLNLKQELFQKLDAACSPETILATNTSSLSVTEIGANTKRLERVIGLHYFNPVPIMKLVEIVATFLTDMSIIQPVYEFCERTGKVPITTKDSPGFVVNRLLVPYLNDAAKAVESGLASVEDIDKAMVHALGYPMGPCKLMDTIGLDVCVMVSEIMFNAFKDSKYAAPPILKNMVKGGLHGKKTGRGFYNYAKPRSE